MLNGRRHFIYQWQAPGPDFSDAGLGMRVARACVERISMLHPHISREGASNDVKVYRIEIQLLFCPLHMISWSILAHFYLELLHAALHEESGLSTGPLYLKSMHYYSF